MSKKTEYPIETEVALSPNKSEREKKWLEEEIEIEFYNIEEPGLSLKFPYGSTREHKIYTLYHGGKYVLPRKVIQHLESRATPIWKWRPDGTGSMAKELVGTAPRFQCKQTFS